MEKIIKECDYCGQRVNNYHFGLFVIGPKRHWLNNRDYDVCNDCHNLLKDIIELRRQKMRIPIEELNKGFCEEIQTTTRVTK